MVVPGRDDVAGTDDLPGDCDAGQPGPDHRRPLAGLVHHLLPARLTCLPSTSPSSFLLGLSLLLFLLFIFLLLGGFQFLVGVQPPPLGLFPSR